MAFGASEGEAVVLLRGQGGGAYRDGGWLRLGDGMNERILFPFWEHGGWFGHAAMLSLCCGFSEQYTPQKACNEFYDDLTKPPDSPRKLMYTYRLGRSSNREVKKRVTAVSHRLSFESE